MSPLRPAGSADRYGVPKAEESETGPEEPPACGPERDSAESADVFRN
jgi:hypothetical protein